MISCVIRGYVVLSILFGVASIHAETLTMDETTTRLAQLVELGVEEWSFKWGDFAGPDQPSFDDSDWEVVGTDYRWLPPDSRAWYRKWIEIPDRIAGVAIEGSSVWLWLQFIDDGIVYVDGHRADLRNHTEGRVAMLSESAQPGERICVAVHIINNAFVGGLEAAELRSDRSESVVEGIREYLTALGQTQALVLGKPDRSRRDMLVVESLELIDPTVLVSGRVAAFNTSLGHAADKLKESLDILRSEARSKLNEAADLLIEMDTLLNTAWDRGIDISYPLVSRTVVHNFFAFAEDDLSSDETLIVARGVGVAGYLIASSNKAIQELHRLIVDDDFARRRRVPRYGSGDVMIKDGALYQGDRPVFLNGFGHFSQVRKDIPIFSQYGFNAIQTISSPNGVVRRDSINTEYVDNLVEVLDRAAEHNVAVDLLIADSFVGWAYEDYPELRVGQGGSLCFNIEHPAARTVLRRYLEAVIPAIADHPALFSICLTNEPSYTDDGPISEQNFHTWLEAKHGSVQNLNTIYGASYSSFNDIPLPTREGAFDGSPPRPVWYDWCRYNQDRTYAHHRWMRDVIHTMAPDLLVQVKIQGRVFDGQYQYPWGVNPEEFSRLGRISGGDNYSYDWSDLDRGYAQGWWRQAMFYDFQRSVAPNNPIFNSENHPIEDANPAWVSGKHMQTMLWQGAIHGQCASTTWVWEHQLTVRGSVAASILTRPNCVEAFGRAALDLNRLGEEVVALQKAKAQVAILFSSASIPQNESYLDESKNAYEGLYFLDTPVRFVTDRMASEGKLSDYRLLVAPGNAFVPDSTTQAVERFVLGGGTLLVVGNAFNYDEYGNTRDLNETQIVTEASAAEQYSTWQLGEGRVIHIGASMEPKQYADLLDELLDDAGVIRDIRVADHHHKRPWGVRTQTVKRDGGYLVYIVNLFNKPRTVELVAERPLGSSTDLLTGERCGPIMELQPLEPKLLFVEKP
jgi:hypothetical protein